MAKTRNRGGGTAVFGTGIGIAWLLVGLAAAVTGSQARADSGRMSCRQLGAVPGPEDLVPEASRDRVLVSSQDRRTKPQPQGAIYAVALEAGSTSGPQPLRLVGRDDCSFHPHGISLVSSGDGAPRLYVINHHLPGDTSPSKSCLPGGERLARHGSGFTSIEVFEVEQNRLRFLRRLADPQVLRNGNDLVALPDGTVYVTSPPDKLFGMLQDLLLGGAPGGLRRSASEIVKYECDGAGTAPCKGRFRSLAKLGKYVNGIEVRELENGGRKIYVASTLERVLYEVSDDDWQNPKQIAAPKGLDNLSWKSSERKVLIAAGHSNMRRFLQHARSPEAPSPSTIWGLSVTGKQARRKILTDEGSLISAASAGACAGEDLVLGQVFESAVLLCEGGCQAEQGATR